MLRMLLLIVLLLSSCSSNKFDPEEFYRDIPNIPPRYDLDQWKELRLGEDHGVAVDKYNDPTKYDWRAMREIRLGLEEGVDVTDHIYPRMSYKEIRKVRHMLEEQR